MIGDSVIRNPDGSGDIVGVVDLIICATCLHQAGRLVKMASPAEVDELVRKSYEDDQEKEKLKDEIQSWQQRLLDLSKFDKEDLAALNELKEREEIAVPPSK
jgi:pantothenate kinase